MADTGSGDTSVSPTVYPAQVLKLDPIPRAVNHLAVMFVILSQANRISQ